MADALFELKVFRAFRGMDHELLELGGGVVVCGLAWVALGPGGIVLGTSILSNLAKKALSEQMIDRKIVRDLREAVKVELAATAMIAAVYTVALAALFGAGVIVSSIAGLYILAALAAETGVVAYFAEQIGDPLDFD
ncbi:MAG: hypothetical protein KDK48_02265 [Chlamydiia bacterium]|nr:hypothetical protein [Chlamydiia bacterium]